MWLGRLLATRMQRLEVQVNFDNAENAASVCIAMSCHRIDTQLELLERPPANLFCPASSASSRSTVRPTNYTSISQRYGSIKGRWVINPSLSNPSSVLPPLPEVTSEDAGKNLFLETKDGKIKADVTSALAPSLTVAMRRRGEGRGWCCT